MAYVSRQLRFPPSAFSGYVRDHPPTRREHLAELYTTYRIRSFTHATYRELAQALLPTALNTDSGVALVAETRTRKIVLPGIITLERLGWEVRRRAQHTIFTQLITGLTSA